MGAALSDVDRTFDTLVEEAVDVPIHGWNFSWLDGRATEERPSWGYSRLLDAHMATAANALDVQTGGGEVLAALEHLAPRTVATEGWPANVEIAARRLRERAVGVVHTADGDPLPFRANTFDLIASRHPTVTSWLDIHGVLQPGGMFITQQVGSNSVDELRSIFRGRVEGTRHMDNARAEATRAGLVVVRAEEEFPEVTFFDVGAIVYFLRLVVWIVPDFTVDRYRPQLRELHDRIRAEGSFVARAHRYLIEARKTA